jgi:acyl carrier protein
VTAPETVTTPEITTAGPDPGLRHRIVDQICALLPRVLKRDAGEVSEGTSLMDDLGMSSTSALELMLELEEDLQVEISVEDLDRDDFDTVGSLADYVAGNLLTDE